MISTNQMRITFDCGAIARDFVLFEVRRDQGDYKTSPVPDAALQQCRALGVAYDWGRCCYLLYRRGEPEQVRIRRMLEQWEPDVCVRELAPQTLAETRAHLLAQLLCNALPNLGCGGVLYHNAAGKLLYWDPKWTRRRQGKLVSFWVLQISISEEHCVKLEVKTFTNLQVRREKRDLPQYVFDPDSCLLRRALKEEGGERGERFVMAGTPGQKHTVSYLEFGSLSDYRSCKVGVLQQFLGDVGRCLRPYLTLEMVCMDESLHLGSRSGADSMEGIRRRLRESPLYLEDTVQDGASQLLCRMLRQQLQRYSGVSLLEGPVQKGASLLRIIHHAEYYEDCPQQDNYALAPKDCVVQHLTVEDVQLTGLNRAGTQEREDPALRKVIQELAIKRDVHQGQMACYDWSALGYAAPVTFVDAQYRGKKEPVRYGMVRVWPDGKLQFDRWQRSLEDTPEREAIARAFERENGTFDFQVKGLVYEDADHIHVICDTQRYTLPDMENLERILRATCDEEPIPVPAIVQGIRQYAADRPEEAEQCARILEAICPWGQELTRKELRRALNLRSALGRQLNAFLLEHTGILVGGGLKSKEKREELFGGVLDIRHFNQDGVQFYYAGYRGSSLQQSLPHACRIRSVRTTGGPLQFERYLPLLEVDFVRASGWTVIPFPFKYLREWEQRENRG